jgi:hypothetical protein
VKVNSPPRPAATYLLVIKRRLGDTDGYFLKGVVPAAKGTHPIPINLENSPPGSWREVAVVSASPTAMDLWRTTDAQPLTRPPDGSVQVTAWKPLHRDR